MIEKKTGRYQRLVNQYSALVQKSNNPLSRMASLNAILYHKMDNFFWTGVYLLNEGRLCVGPYQGPLACMELEINKGVCWTSITNKKTIVVNNVEDFPGHIACDSRSKSEIVVPIYDNQQNIIGVLDIDSSKLSNFDAVDKEFLEILVKLIYSH